MLTHSCSVIKARSDSTVKRTHTHRKTMSSYDPTPASFENVPTAQLDEQIRMRSQQGMYTLSRMERFRLHDSLVLSKFLDSLRAS